MFGPRNARGRRSRLCQQPTFRSSVTIISHRFIFWGRGCALRSRVAEIGVLRIRQGYLDLHDQPEAAKSEQATRGSPDQNAARHDLLEQNEPSDGGNPEQVHHAADEQERH